MAENLVLTDIPFGAEATVVSVDGAENIVRRLMEMGVIPGVSVSVVKSAPFGDPIEIKVRGYNLAIRKAEAEKIAVTKIENTISK